MVVLRYKLDFSRERHAQYCDSFYTCDDLKSYFIVINKFLKDEKLSPNNQDDVELFRDLLFESKFSTIQLDYALWLIGWVKKKNLRLIILDRYIKYISSMSDLHASDFWNLLLKDEHKKLIEKLLKRGTAETRVKIVLGAVAYNPKIMKTIPKLKTYLIFS